MRVDKDTFHFVGGASVFVISLVLMITLLAMHTLQEVSQSTFAVEYNHYTCKFGRILEQGKYSTDVGVELLSFGRTLQDLSLSGISCLTKDKILVDLDLNMQIQYHAKSLIPIVLKDFNGDKKYKSFLSALAKSTVLNTCLEFTAEDYYSKRSSIDGAMTSRLEQTINMTTTGSTMEFFQLIDIRFPPSFSSLMVQKQNTEQLETTLINNRANEITVAKTALFVANNTANIKIIQAHQQAQTVLNAAETNKAVVEAFWENRAEVYESVMRNFGYNATQLAGYIRAETVRSSKKLLASVGN